MSDFVPTLLQARGTFSRASDLLDAAVYFQTCLAEKGIQA